MKIIGASASPEIHGSEEFPGRANYFLGSDPKRWLRGIPTYGAVRYQDLYPGIDLVYHGNAGRLEYDFVVSPGADPGKVLLAFDGAESLRIDGDTLLLRVGGGEVRLSAPVAYQGSDELHDKVACRFVSRGGNRISFETGEYDTTRELTIDPVLLYSTYLGGTGNEYGFNMTVDSSGNAFITGPVTSVDFPTASPLQPVNQKGPTGQDAFVSRLNASGDALVYSTYLGGNNDDLGYDIAVDSSGSAHVIGNTSSGDFPVVNAHQSHFGGFQDAFVARLNPTGDDLVFSTYIGRDNNDYGYGVALDPAGNVYAGLFTFSNNLPTTSALYAGSGDTYLLKMGPYGGPALYTTYVGGNSLDLIWGLAVDSSGSLVVAGETLSENLPVKSAIQPAKRGGRDAFVGKVPPSGIGFSYLTYLGGDSTEVATSVALDTFGNVHLLGVTLSKDFPLVKPIQQRAAGNFDLFVTKLSPNGEEVLYSTYLGGTLDDIGYRIAVGPSGEVVLVGMTKSEDFPSLEPLQQPALTDAFITKLNPAGTAIVFSTRIGGGGIDEGYGTAVSPSGIIYATGHTSSDDFPTISPLQRSFSGGGRDAFIAKLAGKPADTQLLLYFPRLVSTAGTLTGLDSSEYLGLAVANLDRSGATVKFSAYDSQGAIIAGSGVSNPASASLAPGQQMARVDHQLWGQGLLGKARAAWCRLESTSPRLVGFFLMFNDSLSILDGADVSAQTLGAFVLPEIEEKGFTQIHVANPGSRAVGLTLDLMRADGSRRGRAARAVPANGTLVESLPELFPGVTAAASDYIRGQADGMIVPFEFLGKKARYVAGLNGQAIGGGSKLLYSPQYVVGGPEWSTSLSLVNLENSEAKVTLRFMGDDGKQLGVTKTVPISALGKLFIGEQNYFLEPGTNLTQGYVEIKSDGAHVSGSVLFGDPARDAFGSSLPLPSSFPRSMVFCQVVSNSTYFTGLSLLNTEDSNAAVVIEVCSADGVVIASKTEILPPRQRVTRLLTQYFPGLAALEINSGYIKIRSDRSLAGFALFGTRDLSVLSAIPPQVVP